MENNTPPEPLPARVRIAAVDDRSIEKKHIPRLRQHRHRPHPRRDFHVLARKNFVASDRSGHTIAIRADSGTTIIVPFSRSQSSIATHAAMHVPGCTRR
jgi:hypothetical protein